MDPVVAARTTARVSCKAVGGLLLLLCLLSTVASRGAPPEDLFDGRSLSGWKASENPGSFRVENGAIVCNGPRAHLFYTGPDGQAVFKNFELEAEVLARPGANSGIYFHTAFQDSDWPVKGFEIQVNNTHLGEGSYRENKRTGSLYGIRRPSWRCSSNASKPS